MNNKNVKVQNSQQEKKKEKNPFLFLVIILLMLIFSCISSYIGYLYGKSKCNEEKTTISTDNTTETQETADTHEEDSEESTDTTETTEVSEELKECLYDDGLDKFSFMIPKDWECIEQEAAVNRVYNITIKSEHISLQVAFPIAAACSSLDECEEETLFNSDTVYLNRVIGENPDGSIYASSEGFFKEKPDSAIGLKIIEPNLNDRSLNDIEREELNTMLTNVTIPEE